MSQLSEYLELIKNEKDTKILPENIINGITILGVPGNSEFTARVDTSIQTAREGILNYIIEIRGLDLSEIPTTKLNSFFANCYNIKKISFQNSNTITNMSYLFRNCENLEEIDFSEIDTSNVNYMQQMFYNCQKIIDIPQLNVNNVIDLNNMFFYCISLSNESLNNILAMCINATSYTGTKTLVALGFASSWCPASRIQALSNYQAFLNARWTIGY